ncbi:MAG: cytochrome c biogenesis protein CcsA [Bacteroidia bacterium]|nr:cytochrome c biogenesis protein CcsA [Bacteroidia bacterium]
MPKEIIYNNEHLWLANLGNAFISVALAAALFSSISYYLSFRNPNSTAFKSLARTFFTIHVISVFGIIGSIFWMMLNHYFEFTYVWQHTNMEMETRYVFAAFWEDQAGSFLLWTFWHAVIGVILMCTSKKWEAPVMVPLGLVQTFLCIMVVGIYFKDLPIGKNPFALLRDAAENFNAPIFQDENYVSKMAKTAHGLNPLLKNYWMTIHPPTLFLGFALTVVPFCFAIAGLMTRKHKEWQKIALPWSFVGVLVLGTGILMGGAWAYEALSFGGFWAWDPVENASFVPWLTLVGTAHLILINKSTGRSVFSTYIFSVVTFILVLYSTFLTRSGILGDSSVHAFTELGLERLLVFFLMFFMAMPVAFLMKKWWAGLIYFSVTALLIVIGELIGHRTLIYWIWGFGTIAIIFYEYFKNFLQYEQVEERAWSREFWMFIGALLLMLFAIAVGAFTSLPVFNRMFGTKTNLQDNGINLYNIIGLIFGIFILGLMAITQFFKYKNTDMRKWKTNFIYSGILAFVATAVIVSNFYNTASYAASSPAQKNSFGVSPFFIFFALFALFANGEYFVRVLKGKIKNAGSAIAHIGFAMVMIGCVISNSGKRVISKNKAGGPDISALGPKFSNNTNIFLQKNDTIAMGEYFVTYKGKEKKGINVYYQVEYFSEVNGKKEYQFTLYPLIQLNERMGSTNEPDTKHFLSKDVYTDITYAETVSKEELEVQNGWTGTENNVIHLTDSIVTNEYIITLDSLKTSLNEEEFKKQDSVLVVTAVLSVFDMQKKVRKVYPQYILRNREVIPTEFIDDTLGLKFVFWKINPEEGSVEITLSEKVAKKKEFIVMEAFEFPWINVLWGGCLIMIFGTGLAVFHRIRQNRISSKNEKKSEAKTESKPKPEADENLV